MFLDPAPSFTLIPSTDDVFAIPLLSTPSAAAGTKLPDVDQKFVIPTVGAPTFAAVLPNASSTFNIPTVSVSTNATTSLPALPDTDLDGLGFTIPDVTSLLPSAPGSVPNFADSEEEFNIPSPTLATSTVASVPEFSVFVDLAGAPAIRGLTSDGTDFYVVSNGTGSAGVDEIIKVFGSSTSPTATIDTGFATSGKLDGPSGSVESLAFLDSSLWVLENTFRCFDGIDNFRCDREHRIFEIDPSAPPSGDEASWAAVSNIINSPNAFDRIAGFSSEGTGSSGTLWLAHEDGFNFINIDQTGGEVDSPNPSQFVDTMDGLAFLDNTLYTSDSDTITKWDDDGTKVQDISAVKASGGASISGIKGLTFKPVSNQQVLFVGSSDGTIYQGFFADTAETDDPLGIAFSPSSSAIGEFLWILVDGTPFDKILKVNASGTIQTAFGTGGAADSPSTETEGITFLDGSLYIVANETGAFGGSDRVLYKVNPTTGAQQASFNLGNTANIFDDLGGITNDGTDLIVHSRSGFNALFVLDPSNGTRTGIEEGFPCCPSYNGARGMAFNSDRGEFFAARNDAIGTYGDSLDFVTEDTITETSGTIGNIEGMTFDGNLLYMVYVESSTGKVNKSFLGSTAQTVPTGIAFTGSTSQPGEALWILVEGTPSDKLLKVTPSTGALDTSFSDDGFVDAPSADTTGITFLDTGTPSTSFLWIVANESGSFGGQEPKLFKVNANTGALAQTFTLSSTAQMFDDLGGITNDGTDLVLYFEDFNDIVKIDPANGQEVDRNFLCCPNVFGASGFARHADRNQFFAANDDSLLTIDSTLQNTVGTTQTLQVDGTTMSSLSPAGTVKGMAFDTNGDTAGDGDVLYVAFKQSTTGRVSVSKLVDSVESLPRGLAFSPADSTLSGVLIDEALWALVDGDPVDKILKIDPDTDSLLTSFDSPSQKTAGLTFLGGHLYIIANESGQFGGSVASMFKVKGTDGSAVQSFDISQLIFGDMGGITNDGTDLLISLVSNRDIFVVDTSGSLVETRFIGCCPEPSVNGSRASAFNADTQQLLLGKNDDITQLDNDPLELLDEFEVVDADNSNAALVDIQGMTFDQGTEDDATDDVLYIAHEDGTQGKISRAGVPSDITNNPRGLAYDPVENELYILVDGANVDHIVVVDPSSGAADRDFPAPDGNSHGITFLNGSLFVSVEEDGIRDIVELDPDDGSELSSFDVDFLPGNTHAGLATDGENLVVGPQFGGPRVVFIDPNSGSVVSEKFFFDPGQFFEDESPGALALSTTTPKFYTAKVPLVIRFGDEGDLIEEFDIEESGFGGIQGSVFVGNLLYLAESQGDKVYAALVPSVTPVRTTNPRAMATDGASLYLIVDAEPLDKLMKLDPDTPNSPLVTSFGSGGAVDAPGTDIDAIAFHGDGFLYTLSNDLRSIDTQQGVFQFELPVLNKIDPATGESVAFLPILIEDNGSFDFLIEPIDALASDGVFLYGGARATAEIEGVWFKIDVADIEFIEAFGEQIGGPVAEPIDEFEGQLAFMPGFQSMEITLGSEFPVNRQLLASGDVSDSGFADTIARFNRDSGTMFREVIPGATNGQFKLTGTDIKGMDYATSSKLLFLADDVSDKILSTKLPENTGVEITVVGNYDTDLVVDVDSTSNQNVTSVTYSVNRNTAVVVTLDSPDDNFKSTSTAATISGRLNDPSILTVDVDIQLPSTSFVDDEVVDDTAPLDIWDITDDGTGALWHIACNEDSSQGFPLDDEPRFSSDPCSWRFAKPTPDGTFSDFDTGIDSAPTGALTSVATISVGADTELEFSTGYLTEGTADVDVKLVEAAVVTTDAQGNENVGSFEAIIQIVAPGEAFEGDVPANAHPDFVFVQLPPLFISPFQLVPVSFDLYPFAGDDIKLRFRFDAVDDIGNDGEGWYLDDILVTGAGTQTVQVNTTRLDPPETEVINGSSTTLFREFSQAFVLSEGSNVMVANADLSYSPFLSDSAQVWGFVDTIAPIVTLAGLPDTTNDASQTLTGTIDEATLVSLTISQTIFDGTSTTTIPTIFDIGTVPEDGTFSLGVSLGTGINTFTALASDRGLKEGTAEETSVGDFTAPTAIVQIVGVTSEDEALVGDDFFVVVHATDNVFGSGVASVESNGDPLAELVDVAVVLLEMHGLDTVTVGSNASSTTHVQLSDVVAGTPVGVNSISLTIIDEAGNTAIASGELNVVSARSNRNFFLFPSFNFVGLGLIPDDGDDNTTDDASLDRLMTQDVTDRVNPAFADQLGGTATLGDVVESTFAFNKAGNFIVHTPGTGATDTLTDLEPFQGMLVNTNTEVSGTDVFKKVTVAGFTAAQSVPIRINIEGVFFRQGEVPPGKELRVGCNLVAPHILDDTLFDRVYRGALIPDELAVSAVGFERRVDATSDGPDIDAEITEEFVSNSLGDFLKAVFSYWTFIVDDVADTRLNELGEPLGPTITP